MFDKLQFFIKHDALGRLLPHPVLTRILIAVAVLIVTVYFYPHPHASHYSYEEGRPWNYAKLIAPFDLPVRPDSATVADKLDSLAEVFVPVYRMAPVDVDSALDIAIARMEALSLADVPGGSNDNRSGFYRALRARTHAAYRNGVVEDTLPAEFGNTHRSNIRLLQRNVLRSVPTAQYITHDALLGQIDSLAGAYGTTRRLRNSGLATLLRPSIVLDVPESQRIYANDKAIATIDRGVIQRGQTIIDKGAVITPQDYTNLRTYEELLASRSDMSARNDLLMLAGQTLFVAMLLGAFMFYIYYQEPEIWNSLRAVAFALMLPSTFFLLAVASNAIFTGGIYLVPLSIVAVLMLVFFNARTAIMTSTVTVLLCAPATTFTLEFVVMQFAAAMAAVFSLRDLSRRSQLLRASLLVGVAYLLSYCGVQLMVNGSFDDFSVRLAVLLTVNAMLTSLAYVLMFGIEHLFGFVSNVTLVELSDTNTPLLRQLSDECPGTFQHSMAVSTLASDAARAIGANTLLVRAGAMYHDIGKIDNPVFFTENQHGVNPHDGLLPERSAGIIINHVEAGLRRAERAGIPAVIRNFISQHHGRGQAKYFYITACRENPDTDPAPYTYPGPNPTSRETSLMMMADSVEAASRSLREHTPAAITDLVNKIIDGQIAEGLHADSPISFRDVSLIKRAFVRRLMTIYHSRIEYPDAPKR